MKNINYILLLSCSVLAISVLIYFLASGCPKHSKKEEMMFIDDTQDLENPETMRREELWPLGIGLA
jgi:hypothetical protein